MLVVLNLKQITGLEVMMLFFIIQNHKKEFLINNILNTKMNISQDLEKVKMVENIEMIDQVVENNI